MEDSLGDRMKDYERARTEDRLIPGMIYYARIDGRSFSKFTEGMQRPFDPAMTNAMVATTKYLVEQTHAKLGYVQSDEISLVWEMGPDSQMLFDGKIQKLCSILAGMASAKFLHSVFNYIEGNYFDKIPHFDCRIFEIPSRDEAANAMLWRFQDATRNAISMAASSLYSHKKLLYKNSEEKLQMIADAGVVFDDYSPAFRLGTFVWRDVRWKYMDPETLAKIPEHKRPIDGLIQRTVTETGYFDLSYLNHPARVGFIFG